MADEIRVTTTGGGGAGATLPGSVDTAPADPHAARAQIEATRARMSETIDDIEEVLLRKKEQIQDRLDFLSPVRERPVQVLGAVFGAGLLLGLLTGGDDEENEVEIRSDAGGWGRADDLEERTRRLMRIAREQEAELEVLRARLGAAQRDGAAEDLDEVETGGFGRMRDETVSRVGGAIADAVSRMLRG